MANNKDFKVKNGIQPTVYHEGLGTVTSGSEGYYFTGASDTTNTLDISTDVGSNPTCIRWNSNGLKLFVLSYTDDAVYTFTLTSAYDLSTATVDATSYDFFTTEASNQITFHFNNDGSKFYVPAYTSAKQVYQYSLSTAYDLSSESYDGAVTVSSVAYGIGAVAFKSDGTKVYFFDNYALSNKIWQYDLSTAWDVTSTLSNEVTLDLSGDLTVSGSDLLFNPDGSSFLVTLGSDIIQYDLSTAWDVSTATQGVSFDASSLTTLARSPNYSSDGTRLFFSDQANREIQELSTAQTTNTLDLSTRSIFEITPTSDIQIGLSNPAASGTVSQATLLLEGYAVETDGYDLSVLSYDDKKASVPSGTAANPRDISLSDDGTKMYVLHYASAATDDVIKQYTLSTAWDISTATYLQEYNWSGITPWSEALYFKPDGTAVFIGDDQNDGVRKIPLSTAWDISTATTPVSFYETTLLVNVAGLFFKPDGTEMYMAGQYTGGALVVQFSLSTAWDVTTSSQTDTFSVAGETADPQSLAFSNDGTKMFVMGTNDDIYEYPLTTGWDLTTAGATTANYSLSTQNNSMFGIHFREDGVKMYAVGQSNNHEAYQYTTGTETAATITYDSTIEFSGGTAPTSPDVGETDVITFSTRDGGTTYQAVQAIDGAS